MRVLGVDFGRKRIGLAVGDSQFRTVAHRPNLNPSGILAKDAENISAFAKKEEAEAVAVGIPVNQGASDRAERVCRELAAQIRRLGWEVHEVDESLTSVEGAENLTAVYRRGAVRRKLDSEAAALILERFFDAQE